MSTGYDNSKPLQTKKGKRTLVIDNFVYNLNRHGNLDPVSGICPVFWRCQKRCGGTAKSSRIGINGEDFDIIKKKGHKGEVFNADAYEHYPAEGEAKEEDEQQRFSYPCQQNEASIINKKVFQQVNAISIRALVVYYTTHMPAFYIPFLHIYPYQIYTYFPMYI
jgi:hypothetical protein